MPRDDKFWNWQLRREPFFAPVAGVGVRWTFLGHREWGFAPDRQFIVYRDGAIPWEMLRRRRNVSILAVENDPRGFHDVVPKLSRFGNEVKTFDSTFESTTRIDDNLIVLANIISMIPLVEQLPVVATSHQHKLSIRIILLQGLQSVPGVRWFGQMHLVVAGYNAFFALDSKAYHLHPYLVVEQVG